MDIFLRAHLVSSYDDWKVIFDGDAEARKAFVSGDTLVGQADDKSAIIAFFGVDMDAMGAFLRAPEFAKRTSKYVSGHDVYSLSKIEPPA